MSTTTKLGDEFLCIPILNVSGSNWVLYKECFSWALDACGILDHIDGTVSEPTDPISKTAGDEGELSFEQQQLATDWKKELK